MNVYIDGKDILNAKKTEESLGNVASSRTRELQAPLMRATIAADVREKLCTEAEGRGAKITITGIQRSYLNAAVKSTAPSESFTLVVDNGKIICFDSQDECASASTKSTLVNLKNGHVLPGLTAVSQSLGLAEIPTDLATGDGVVKNPGNLSPNETVYAKYGVHLEGKAFGRARIGGVTRVVTAPISGGFADGVSVGIKTSGKKTILDGGVFQDDVALHFVVGQAGKGKNLYSLKSEWRTD